MVGLRYRSHSWRVYPLCSAARSLLPSWPPPNRIFLQRWRLCTKARAERAFAAGDYRTARLCFERLALEDGRPELVYALSRSCWALGEKERAAALLAKIASAAGRRLRPRSHVASPTSAVRSQTIGIVETNRSRPLAAILADDPDSLEAHALLGGLALEAGHLDESETHLARAAASMPELNLSLARLYDLRHDGERSRQHAGQAATFFRTEPRPTKTTSRHD